MSPSEQPRAVSAPFRYPAGDTSAVLERWTVTSDIGFKPSGTADRTFRAVRAFTPHRLMGKE